MSDSSNLVDVFPSDLTTLDDGEMLNDTVLTALAWSGSTPVWASLLCYHVVITCCIVLGYKLLHVVLHVVLTPCLAA